MFDRYQWPRNRRIPIISGGNSALSNIDIAKAVHFDGMTWLKNLSLTATDSNFFSFSFWFRNTDPTRNMDYGIPFVVDPENNYTTFGDFLGADPDTVLAFACTLENEAGNKGILTNIASPPAGDANWHNLLYSGETGQASGSNNCKLFLDDIDVGNTPSDQGPFGMVFNGKSFWFGADNFGGGDGSGIVGDIADVWIAPNVYLIDGSGTIPVATRRLFIDAMGHATNPSGFPASAILFSGNKTTFPVNQGSGGTFTLTGTLTDAATHP